MQLVQMVNPVYRDRGHLWLTPLFTHFCTLITGPVWSSLGPQLCVNLNPSLKKLRK